MPFLPHPIPVPLARCWMRGDLLLIVTIFNTYQDHETLGIGWGRKRTLTPAVFCPLGQEDTGAAKAWMLGGGKCWGWGRERASPVSCGDSGKGPFPLSSVQNHKH